jgi:hypothetical protein
VSVCVLLFLLLYLLHSPLLEVILHALFLIYNNIMLNDIYVLLHDMVALLFVYVNVVL